MIVNTDHHPILKTARLHLRGLQPADAGAIFALRSDKAVNAHLDRKPAETPEDAVNFINSIAQLTGKGDGLYWGITSKENDQLVGTICLYNFDREKGIAEIGYELLPHFQGKGLMQEALTAVTDHAFETMKLKLLVALPHTDNENSIKLLSRNHFVIDPAYAYLNEPGNVQSVTYVLKNPAPTAD